jgi:glucose-1-phosphate adenylyltransferase
MELTDRRGKTRIIDFALSNALNSGIPRIGVATQYKAHSLIKHLQHGWTFFRPERNESFDILPASQRVNENSWYLGTADAVYQNIDIISSYAPKYIIILAGDHVYKQDYGIMLEEHCHNQADVTVGCVEVPIAEASAFGVMHVDAQDRIIDFLEKPANPPSMPDDTTRSLASMGIYIFDTEFLFARLREDAEDPNSSHDFGKDIIPHLVEKGRAFAHRFTESCVRSSEQAEPYWRDVGTVEAYWQANIDLTDVIPPLDLYDSNWPIWSNSELSPPAKFVHDIDGRRGQAITSLVSGGCIVSGSSVRRSLLFTGVRAHSHSSVEEGVILPYVDIGRNARLSKVVVDAGVHIPDGLVVGEDPILDGKRFRRTESGICLITQPMIDALSQ